MTATLSATREPATGTGGLHRIFHWHRPLIVVAALMAICALVSIVGLVVDDREILGAPAWAKPLKFSASILLYTVTWAWLIAHLPRWRHLAQVLGTVIAVTLAIEQVAIIWAASTGTTSHFNVSDGAHATVWAIMAAAITTMYICTFITSLALFFMSFARPAITAAVRAGAVIALIGIGVAFLMTGPTEAQLTTPTGIIGAHTVGSADGGPGLPVLGWSTTGGDYRVAHFIGMHALQIIPLFAITLAAAARRMPALRSDAVQLRIVVAVAIAYLIVVILLTIQAALGLPFIGS